MIALRLDVSSSTGSGSMVRPLKEGYVVVIPGTRGRNLSIVADKQYAKTHNGVKTGQTIYTGRAPKAILDLKAAIRYLRHFDKQIPAAAWQLPSGALLVRRYFLSHKYDGIMELHDAKDKYH